MLPEEAPLQPEVAPVFEPVTGDFAAQLRTPHPERDPFWGYSDLALVVGLLGAAVLVIVLAAALAVFIWPRLQADQAPLILPTNLAMYFFLVLILKLTITSRYGRPMLKSLGWRMTDSKTLVYAALAGAALPFLISAVGYVLRTPKISTEMDKMMESMPIVPLVITAIALAPFFEELFFRGFLQPLLTRSLGLAFGILLTGGIFGGIHAAEYSFVWQYVVAITLVGVALGIVRAWTNSIVPTTVMHACFNGLQVIAFAADKHK